MEIDNYKSLNCVYAEIAEEFGLEATLRFYSLLKGIQVTFPKHLFDREYIIERIKKEYNGKNIKELSLKYDYSERWIREILRTKTEQKSV